MLQSPQFICSKLFINIVKICSFCYDGIFWIVLRWNNLGNMVLKCLATYHPNNSHVYHLHSPHICHFLSTKKIVFAAERLGKNGGAITVFPNLWSMDHLVVHAGSQVVHERSFYKNNIFAINSFAFLLILNN